MVIILLLVIIYKIFLIGEKLTSDRAAVEGGYLGRFLANSKGYIGHPLTETIPDSGADLRFATEFTSTDQGSEFFKNISKNYK